MKFISPLWGFWSLFFRYSIQQKVLSLLDYQETLSLYLGAASSTLFMPFRVTGALNIQNSSKNNETSCGLFYDLNGALKPHSVLATARLPSLGQGVGFTATL